MIRACVGIALALSLIGAAPTYKPLPISIAINGSRLPLQPSPILVQGQLYVPVRRTIEALGLAFNRQGKRVWTQLGSKTATLTIGSRVATIDDATVLLDTAPIEIKDVLYAPLRFFTDVLGAQADYNRHEHLVSIVAQLAGTSNAGIEQNGDVTQRFGTVSAVDVTSDPPTVTLTNNASVRTITIGANAEIEMRDIVANVSVPGELSDVRPGDFARIDTNREGHVTRVEDDFGSYDGRVAAATSSEFVIDDGHVIVPSRTTQIVLNGKPAAIGDLQDGDRVTVRYNVETNEVRSILASRTIATTTTTTTATASGPAITSITPDATRPLKAGETLGVTLRGTPGGVASFDIGSYVTDIAMSEQSAGIYTGSYELPAGASFTDVPILGHLRVRGVDAPDVQATDTLSVSGSPPGISDFAPDQNATVNASRPSIYATFATNAVEVNPASVLIWVNGRDVTSESQRTARFVQYTPGYDYPSGNVRVTVRVADLAGNRTTKNWNFTIRR